MSLKGVATRTIALLDAGTYVAPSGRSVSIRDEQRAAIAGTALFRPDQLAKLLTDDPAAPGAEVRGATVSDESTQAAARRLVEEGASDLVLLNFASARNAGGGFINGAKAQEEDLCRCSGLYPTLMTQDGYYRANREQDSLLDTDHMIYSPGVAWFATDSRGPLLERPFLASVITAPAPNAGQFLAHGQGSEADIDACLLRRAGMVLALARHRGHRNVLLGAWGCGVFRNRPAAVADAFARWLAAPGFADAFDAVHFAVYGRGHSIEAFRDRFGRRP